MIHLIEVPCFELLCDSVRILDLPFCELFVVDTFLTRVETVVIWLVLLTVVRSQETNIDAMVLQLSQSFFVPVRPMAMYNRYGPFALGQFRMI